MATRHFEKLSNGMQGSLDPGAFLTDDQQYYASVLAGVFVAVYGLVTSIKAIKYVRDYNRKLLLEIDLGRRIITSFPKHNFWANKLYSKFQSASDIAETLQNAAEDPRVVGIIARLGTGGNPGGMAEVQEIREAVLAFRDTTGDRKPTVLFAETFGEKQTAIISYYLATSFKEIFMAPAGTMCLIGLTIEQPFVKSMCEKLGISPELEHREEYKNFKNFFTEKKFTAPHKEVTESLLHDLTEQLTKGIAAQRGVDIEKAHNWIVNGPFLGQEAVEEGLINGLLFKDEVYSYAKEAAVAQANEQGRAHRKAPDEREGTLSKGEQRRRINKKELSKEAKKVQLLYLHLYHNQRKMKPFSLGSCLTSAMSCRKKPIIALVHAEGPVTSGLSKFDMFEGNYSKMGSDTVCSALKAADEDKSVKAIVFRVDTKGGSVVASEAIWRQVRICQKPVVVSMGNFAASGGYYISQHATKIIAQPGTLTGSIGVIFGKMVVVDLMKKLGIDFEFIDEEDNSSAFSALRSYTKGQKTIINKFIDDIYETFRQRVSEGRSLEREKVDKLAKGRVYTGKQALDLGLVDKLGGLRTAIDSAAGELNLEKDAYVVVEYPKKKSLLEALCSGQVKSSEDSREYNIQVLPMLWTGSSLSLVSKLVRLMGSAIQLAFENQNVASLSTDVPLHVE